MDAVASGHPAVTGQGDEKLPKAGLVRPYLTARLEVENVSVSLPFSLGDLLRRCLSNGVRSRADRLGSLPPRPNDPHPTNLPHDNPQAQGSFRNAGPSDAPILRGVEHPLTLAENAVRLGYVSDLHALLRAIDEVMPGDAVLCFEGTTVAPDVASFLGSREAPHPSPIAPNTLWPQPRFFHLPLTGTNLSDLRALSEHYAEPEIADHLVVYRDREVLMWAHDAGSDYVWISRQLPDGMVDAFREILGDALRAEG